MKIASAYKNFGDIKNHFVTAEAAADIDDSIKRKHIRFRSQRSYNAHPEMQIKIPGSATSKESVNRNMKLVYFG